MPSPHTTFLSFFVKLSVLDVCVFLEMLLISFRSMKDVETLFPCDNEDTGLVNMKSFVCEKLIISVGEA